MSPLDLLRILDRDTSKCEGVTGRVAWRVRMVSLRWPRRGLDTRQRVAAIAAVVMVALLLVSASPPRVRGVSPDALAEATRFRSEFGLDDDPANVAAMAANSDPSMAWGVPLTVAEETLMNVRAGVPAELAELRDYRKAHWATWHKVWDHQLNKCSA
jgi:hypothetical protein